jgi:hypothetical protein
MLEMQLDAGLAFRAVEQQLNQLVAIDRIQHFAAVLAVGLQTRTAVGRVDHPPPHHHGQRHDHLDQTDFGERLDAALGKAEIDRTAAFGAGDPRIAATLEHIDFVTALRQRQREQRAGETATDDRDPLRIGRRSGHRAAPRSSISASTSASTA